MAAPDPGEGSAAVWNGERLRGAPSRLRALLVGTEALALVLSGFTIVRGDFTGQSWGRAVLLLGLSVVFEELSRQVGRLRLLVSSGPKPDMTSVWTFAGAVVLYPGQAALLAAAVTGHVWLSRQRAAGQHAYRKLYTAATIVLACLACSTVLHDNRWLVGALPPGGRAALTLAVALLVYTGTNRLLISLALLCSGAPTTLRTLVGGWDDNALEIATLCLGSFAALSVVYQPWLAPLVLMPALLLQRGALVKELEHAASTDTKTQLLTALAWQQRSERALQQAGRDSTPIAVLLIDLDHFKHLNDTYGHLAGDAALLVVADQLKGELRKSDLVGRFGGEEFVILLPDLDADTSLVVAERIRARIAAIRVSALGVATTPEIAEARPLSASIGVSHSPQHGTELAELLRAADAALYHAKRTGRNRVEVAGRPGSEGHVSAVN
jgi:diguanylate cyclase (GGDEF)-like protein